MKKLYWIPSFDGHNFLVKGTSVIEREFWDFCASLRVQSDYRHFSQHRRGDFFLMEWLEKKCREDRVKYDDRGYIEAYITP